MSTTDQSHVPLTTEQFQRLQEILKPKSRVQWVPGETSGIIRGFSEDANTSSGVYIYIDWFDTGNGLPHPKQNIIELSFLIDGEIINGQSLLDHVRIELPTDLSDKDILKANSREWFERRAHPSPLVFEKLEIGGIEKQTIRKNELKKIFIASAFPRGAASVAVGFSLFNADQLRSLAQQLIEAADELDSNDNFPFVK
jgi:hypothetical protein